MAVYFDRRGRHNTQETARLALTRAEELGVEHVVVASNTGYSIRPFLGKGPQIVCVTHHVGFREPGFDEMGTQTREELADLGVKLLTTTHLFGNVERAITGQQGGLYPGGIVANALRLFSQGTKVAVEIAVMALDAGLIPFGKPVISLGGSGGGLDTALVILPSHAKTFFDTEVLELICKPRNPKG